MKTLINIDVPELEPAIAFYCAALSLTHSRSIDDDVAELTGASSTIYLLRQAADSRPVHGLTEVRQYTRHWTPVHVDFVVDDVEQAAQRARKGGAVQESESVNWRGSKCISFSDPFGHGFCLIEFDREIYR
jgi:predicted enzyme related to lactoylglutathione lyase